MGWQHSFNLFGLQVIQYGAVFWGCSLASRQPLNVLHCQGELLYMNPLKAYRQTRVAIAIENTEHCFRMLYITVNEQRNSN